MARPALSAVAELLKPISWFTPTCALACGGVASELPVADRRPRVLAGMTLAGPTVCATSQAVNDWFDRHVDAISGCGVPLCVSGTLISAYALRSASAAV